MSGAVIDAVAPDPPGAPRARMMLQRARWAATAFATFDRDRTRRVVEAVAEAAYQNAERFAIAAVEETGMGVAEHKRRKNEACSRGLVERYAADDYVGMQVDAAAKIVAVPKPAGVVLALTPSTNPIATVYFNVLVALMGRNAVVVSPHPLARKVSAEAAHLLAQAAVAAGAPDGCLQVVEEPTIPLIEALMADDEVDVIVATGGTAVVRAAYRSGNPALGVGPGNVPALVDATADVTRAASCLADSKAFDNSILCTNESVAIVEERVVKAFTRELERHGAHVLDEDEAGRARAALYPGGRIETALAGKDAAALAAAADIRVPSGTRVLVAPFPLDRARGAARAREAVPAARHGDRARRGTRDRGRSRAAAHRRRRPLGRDPLPRPAHDPRLRGHGARAPRHRQRAREHRLVGPGHEPGPDDDGRDRLLRALEPDREPPAAAPRAVDARGLRLRSVRAVRRLRRPAAVVGAAGSGAGRRPPRAERRRPLPRRPAAADPRRAPRAGALAMAELRSAIFIDQLQPQTMCYLGTWIRGRLPRSGMAAAVIEVAPGLDIEPLTDVAVKHTQLQAGILVVERQFGYLEFHSRSTAAVRSATDAVLEALGASASDATPPKILASTLVSRLDHQHTFLINRNKLGSMALPGESLFVLEMQPASYAILAVNEAEKAARIKVVDYRMIGATGRVYLTGDESDVRAASEAATAALEAVG